MSVKVFFGAELSPIEYWTQSSVDGVMVIYNTTWVSVDTGSSPLRSSEWDVGVIRKLTPRGT